MPDLTYEGYVRDIDDPEIEEALAYLLAHDVLICGFTKPSGWPLNFAVLCNDTFYRAADCEPVRSEEEIFEVFQQYRLGGYDALIEWIANRRNMRPLKERKP